MRCVRYEGSRVLSVETCQPREPGPGEVQVRVAYTGICGTDLHIRNGGMDHRVLPSGILGHEMSGWVERLPGGESPLSRGDPVTVFPVAACGTCVVCRQGLEHVCPELDVLGVDQPGAMQTYWTVPERNVVPLPATMPLRHAALVEPTAVAVHDVARAQLALDERALVVGGGPIGLLIGAVAQGAGARVLIVEPSAYRRGLAEAVGLATVAPSATLRDEVLAWSDGAGAEVVFEASGAEAALQGALELAGVRGRIVLVGIHSEPRSLDLMQIFLAERTLLGARLYTREDFRAAVDALADDDRLPEQLITGVVPMGSVGEAFDTMEAGREVMKLLISCGHDED